MSNVWSRLINLAGNITGVLPMANGGSNKALTAVNGGLVYSDADSMEITSAGTSQDWVLSGGAGAPTMSSTTTTAKTIDGSADAVQFTVQGHSTQTSNILLVEKSDGTDLLYVTNVNGTNIRGTTTNDNAAGGTNGFVGEFQSIALAAASANTLASTTAENLLGTTLDLTAGDWDLAGGVVFNSDGATVSVVQVGVNDVTGTLPTNVIMAPNASNGRFQNLITFPASYSVSGEIPVFIPRYRVSLSGSTSLYLVVRAVFSVASVTAYGYLQARRVR